MKVQDIVSRHDPDRCSIRRCRKEVVITYNEGATEINTKTRMAFCEAHHSAFCKMLDAQRCA